MNAMRTWLAVLGCVWVAASVAPASAADEARPLPLPEMTIARTPKPPVIDGVMRPGEWDFAAAGTGFQMNTRPVQRMAHNQSVFFLTWDEKFLYFAVKNYRATEHDLLHINAREGDDVRIVFDDTNELWLTPPGSPQATYQTMFNSYPAVYDVKFIQAVGYQAKGWSGRWDMASSQTREYWIVEGRTPIKAYDVPAIRDGDVWGFLFSADLLSIKDDRGFRRWGPWLTGGFADAAGHDRLVFRNVAPVLQVLDVESLAAGKAAIPLAVTGPAKGSAKVAVTVRIGAAEGPDANDLVLTKTVTLAGGAREQFTLDADLSKLPLPRAKFAADSAEVPYGVCEITAIAEGKSIYHQAFGFAVDGFHRQPPQKLLASPYESAFGTKAFHAPLSKKLVVTVDRYYLKDRESAVGGTVRLLDAKGNAVATGQVAPFRNDYSNSVLDLAALKLPVQTDADWQANQPVRDPCDPKKILKPAPEVPVGPQPVPFTVETTLTDAQGNALAKTTTPIDLMEYQFEWLGNDIGISDKVIPPWTPMALRDGAISMWNKTYRLDGLGLAEGIVNAGRKQLSGPMKLVAVIDGKETPIAAGKATPGKLAEAYETFSGSGQLGDLEVKVETRVEMDGFVRNRMTLVPKKPVKLDKLSLVVTMPAGEAPCMVSTAGGWSATHGWTPKQWSSREMASGSRYGSFVPYVLLTDSERGFCWAADNDHGWVIDPNGDAVEVATEGDTTTMRVNFVQRPAEIAEPVTIEYAWTVSPQKPQPAGWRATDITYVTAFPKVPWTVFYADFDRRVAWDYYSSPYPKDMAKSRQMIQSIIKSRPKVRYCVGHTGDAIGHWQDYKGRDFTPLAADWGETPGQTGSGECDRCRGVNDYEIWNWDRWIKLGGLEGIYFDINYLGEHWNYLTGSAYVLPGGRIQPGYSYLGQREYHKRLRQIFHDNGKPLPNLWLHSTSGQPVFSWMGDVLMEGENVMPTGMDDDYQDAYPAARARSIGRGENIGAAAFTMKQADRNRANPAHAFLSYQYIGWMWVHDIVGGDAQLQAENEMWQGDIRFLPYWSAGTGAESKTADAIVSAQVRPGHAILWIVNTAHKDITAEIAVDLAKLGLDAAKTVAFDAETSELYKLDGGKLTVPVPSRLWRAIRLVQPKALTGDRTFVAAFDEDEVAADEALGHRYAAGSAVRKPDAPGKTGQGVSLDRPCAFDLRHHVSPASGRIELALQLNKADRGTLLAFAPGSPRRTELAGLSLALAGGELSLVARSAQKTETLAKAPWPAGDETAWRTVTVAWQGKALTVSVEGKELLKADVPGGVPVPVASHRLDVIQIDPEPTHWTPARVVLGDLKGAVMDDLVMMRK